MEPDTINWVVHTVVKKLVDKYQPAMEWEDLVAEGMLHAVEKAPLHDPSKGKMSTFLYACVRNHLIDTISKVNREVPLVMDYGYEEPVSRDNKLTLDLMERKLDGRQKEVFKLLRLGHSYREAGEILGVSRTIIGREVSTIKDKFS